MYALFAVLLWALASASFDTFISDALEETNKVVTRERKKVELAQQFVNEDRRHLQAYALETRSSSLFEVQQRMKRQWSAAVLRISFQNIEEYLCEYRIYMRADNFIKSKGHQSKLSVYYSSTLSGLLQQYLDDPRIHAFSVVERALLRHFNRLPMPGE